MSGMFHSDSWKLKKLNVYPTKEKMNRFENWPIFCRRPLLQFICSKLRLVLLFSPHKYIKSQQLAGWLAWCFSRFCYKLERITHTSYPFSVSACNRKKEGKKAINFLAKVAIEKNRRKEIKAGKILAV